MDRVTGAVGAAVAGVTGNEGAKSEFSCMSEKIWGSDADDEKNRFVPDAA